MAAKVQSWMLLAFICSALTNIKTCTCSDVSLYSSPETEIENGVALIDCTEEETNITIFCQVEKNSLQLATEWYIWRTNFESEPTKVLRQNGIIIVPRELQNNVVISGEPIWNYITFSTNFTILVFTKDFHRSIIQCGTNENRRTFMLGIPTPPLLKQNIGIQVVEEGSSKVISLEVPNNPFPPIMLTNWKFNGQNTTSSDAISYDDYGLVIHKAYKNMTGEYTLTVSTSKSTIQASFFLDVQYEPVIKPIGGLKRIFESENSTKRVILVAFELLSAGNPRSRVSWTGPKGMLDMNLPGKFNASTPGQLMINNVTVRDNGTYVCTIDRDKRFTVDLIVVPSNNKHQEVSALTNIGFKKVISTVTLLISGVLYFLMISI